jgi:thimet oligopeptidase
MYKTILVVVVAVGLATAFLFLQARDSNMIKKVSDPFKIAALFNIKQEDIPLIAQQVIEKFIAHISKICSLKPEKRTYENTFGALDAVVLLDFAVANNIFSVLEMVHPDEAMRTAAHEVMQKMQNVYIEQVSNNKALYEACKEYMRPGLPNDLTKEQLYFIADTIAAFERDGMHLEDERREKLGQIKKEIADLGLTFDRAIAEDKTILEFSISELEDVPSFFIEQLAKNPNNSDLCQVRMDYPTVNMILAKCSNGAVRKKLFCAFNNRAYPENEKTLSELLAKRRELSTLLGYQFFVDYDLSNQMSKTYETVDRFLTDLFIYSRPKAEAEFEELESTIRHPSLSLGDRGRLNPWDVAFIQERYRIEKFNIDDMVVAEYFPLENTIKALLAIYTQFLSIKFQEVPIEGMWHESVRCVQVFDKKKKLLGSLLLDLFPRPGKYSHACHIGVVPACFPTPDKRQPGLSVVLANFSPATENRPSLLKFSEVGTFFHEFGHALHSLLGATPIASLSGTSTKLDFVELPSQLLEEFLWDPGILKKVSKHFETGKPLPDDLIERIVALKTFDAGYFVQRQVYLSKLALRLHSSDDSESLYDIIKDQHERFMTVVAFAPGTHMYCSFGHLYSYSSRYYSYLWSKVFAKDVFSLLKEAGLTNQYMGTFYVDVVLAPGGSKDPYEILQTFLGRGPRISTFFDDLGMNKRK